MFYRMVLYVTVRIVHCSRAHPTCQLEHYYSSCLHLYILLFYTSLQMCLWSVKLIRRNNRLMNLIKKIVKGKTHGAI